jgi:hypothetical protein
VWQSTNDLHRRARRKQLVAAQHRAPNFAHFLM